MRMHTGYGNETPSGERGIDPRYQSDELNELESQDDTFGSGIFDPGGRAATANTNMGVFASHYSLPGYAAREVPFTVSRDVTDITDNAEVVVVPGGGMVYVEEHGKLQRPAILGPTWSPQAIQPAGCTARDQVYAFMTRPGEPPRPPLNPNAPVVAPPTYHPQRDNKYWIEAVPGRPQPCDLARRPASHLVPRRYTVDPLERGMAIKRACPPHAHGQPRAMPAFGAEPVPEPDKQPASAGQLLLAGLILGGATGLVVSLAKKKKKR